MKTLIRALQVLCLLLFALPAYAGYCDQSTEPPPSPAHYVSFTVSEDSVTQAFVVITKDAPLRVQDYLIGVRFDRVDWVKVEGEQDCYIVDMSRFFYSKPLKPNTTYRAAVELIIEGGDTPITIWSLLSTNYTTVPAMAGGLPPRPPGAPTFLP